MTEEKLFIPILLGTNRKDRASEKVASLIASHIADSREDIETAIVDVKDFAFPLDNYGQDIKEQFPQWKETMTRADGLIVVAPEYNHGYPGPLKSVLDLLHHAEYANKVVGFAGVSAGPWGGTRVIENLLPVVRELKLSAIRTDLLFPNVRGEIENEQTKERIDGFLNDLVFVGKSLKWGRENIQ
tara:strand:- start:12145 stop:12699 length:555 start_codon:yes stop_codon:yes gene_type:complete